MLKELFSTGKSMEPTIARLNDHKMALSRDEATIFVDSEGNPTQKSVLTWTEVPVAMGERYFQHFHLNALFNVDFPPLTFLFLSST